MTDNPAPAPDSDDAVEHPALAGQRRIWTIGDYGAVAERLNAISLDLLDHVDPRPGETLLDVGVGNGNTALEAARRGVRVTGIDLTPAQLDKARARAAAEGLDIELHEANAESLPQADAACDLVVSVMGMIFAPDHRAATTEMVRTCRPGGRIALTSWHQSDDSWFRVWRDAVAAAALFPAPPPGGPDPDSWGIEEEMASRLKGADLAAAEVRSRPFTWDFPSVEAALDYFFTVSGPFVALQEGAEAMGRGDEPRAILRGAVQTAGGNSDGSVTLSSPYLLATARR